MTTVHPGCRALESAPQTRLKYDGLSDQQIVGKSQRGDCFAAEYLLYKYRHLVKSRVAVYHLMGAERDDLL